MSFCPKYTQVLSTTSQYLILSNKTVSKMKLAWSVTHQTSQLNLPWLYPAVTLSTQTASSNFWHTSGLLLGYHSHLCSAQAATRKMPWESWQSYRSWLHLYSLLNLKLSRWPFKLQRAKAWTKVRNCKITTKEILKRLLCIHVPSTSVTSVKKHTLEVCKIASLIWESRNPRQLKQISFVKCAKLKLLALVRLFVSNTVRSILIGNAFSAAM